MPELTTTINPLYMELLREIENMILSGSYKENERIPTMRALSEKYSINVGTVQRGVHLLIKKGIIEKKRGIGVFVCAGAYQAIYSERKKQFHTDYVLPLVFEAKKLGISKASIGELIDNAFDNDYSQYRRENQYGSH